MIINLTKFRVLQVFPIQLSVFLLASSTYYRYIVLQCTMDFTTVVCWLFSDVYKYMMVKWNHWVLLYLLTRSLSSLHSECLLLRFWWLYCTVPPPKTNQKDSILECRSLYHHFQNHNLKTFFALTHIVCKSLCFNVQYHNNNPRLIWL